MRQEILQRLEAIEKRHAVRILFAVESGSRAWGMESANSDYDVRFIYVHEPDWYVSLKTRRDVIEEMVDEYELDLSGWELRKALTLLLKGNPVLQEWLSSAVIYRPNPDFVAALTTLLETVPRRKALLYHFRGVAAKSYDKRIEGRAEVRLKAYLYAIRPLLQFLWALRQPSGFRDLPPVAVPLLLDLIEPPAPVREAVLALLEVKKSGAETKTGPMIPVLNEFIKTTLAENTIPADEIPMPKDGVDKADRLAAQIIFDRAFATEAREGEGA